MSEPVVIEPSSLAWPPREGAVHQPWRALVSVAEVVVAGLLGWLAWWLWGEGVDVVGTVRDRPDLVAVRYQGEWIAAAVVAGTVGLVLLLDAIRQLVLAVRSRSK